jgi:hypothetical protein
MKNSIKYLLLISLLVFAISCAEDDDDKKTPTDTTTNYYPLTSGSYWIYARSEVDANGTMSNTTYERSEVSGSEVVSGHNTTKVETYRGDAPNNMGNESEETNNYYSDNGKVYASISFIKQLLTVDALGITIPIETDVEFVKLVDVNATSWDVIELPFTNLPIEFGGQNISFTGKATLKATYAGEKAYSNTKLNLNGNTAAFVYSLVIDGDVKLASIPAGKISVKSTIERWYMKDIGQVKRVDSAISVTGEGLIQQFLTGLGDFPANSFELDSYSVVSAGTGN